MADRKQEIAPEWTAQGVLDRVPFELTARWVGGAPARCVSTLVVPRELVGCELWFAEAPRLMVHSVAVNKLAMFFDASGEGVPQVTLPRIGMFRALPGELGASSRLKGGDLLEVNLTPTSRRPAWRDTDIHERKIWAILRGFRVAL